MLKTTTKLIGFGLLGLLTAPLHAATINKSFCVGLFSKTLSGKAVTFWGFAESGGMMGCGGGMSGSAASPGPVVEIGAGDTLNLTLNVNMMTPQEASPYNGHTVHLHGADVGTTEDGVPETNGNRVNGDTYSWSPLPGHEGSYLYHCHVHTVKHLEMGMYGAMIVRPKDANGAFLNRLTADAATAYDYAQNYILSTVDPAYHTATSDSAVFADYNPAYFLIGGKEGKTVSAPALTLAAAKNKKVAFRLFGLHSTNATLSIKDSAGNLKPFVLYIRDGRKLPVPKTLTSIDISPGQRADVIAALPSTTGTWYPQVTYKKLRDDSPYATVYGKVTF